MENDQDLLFGGGIDGETGQPVANESVRPAGQPAGEQERADLALLQETARAALPEQLSAAYLQNLSLAGWGVVFPEDSDPQVRAALAPLLDHRQALAGDGYQVLTVQTGESPVAFLRRYGVPAGSRDPNPLPFYLLLVGGPEEIPFSFEQQLNLRFGIGRLYFERLDAYRAYADNVVAAEESGLTLDRQAILFGATHPDDRPTAAMRDSVIVPLREQLAAEEPDWQLNTVLGDAATKAALLTLLTGDQIPGFLVAAGHGLNFSAGDRRQLPEQGALVTADWPGPRLWTRGALPAEFSFAASDVSPALNLRGLVALFLSAYSAGTPAEEADPDGRVKRTADAPFIAGLPQALLAQPNGAHAVIGITGTLWLPTLERGSYFDFPRAFTNLQLDLFAGLCLGHALARFHAGYADAFAQLSLEELSGDDPQTTRLRRMLGTLRQLVILGDPFIRLRVPFAERHDQVEAAALAMPAAAAADDAPEESFWEYDDGRVAFPLPPDTGPDALPLLPRAVVRRTLVERFTVAQIKGFYNLVDPGPRYNARKQVLARELVAAAETDEDGGLGILATEMELAQEGTPPADRWTPTTVLPPGGRAVPQDQLLPLLQRAFDAELLLDLAFDLDNGLAEHGVDEKAPTIAAKLVDELGYAGRLDALQTVAFSLNPDAWPEEPPPTLIVPVGQAATPEQLTSYQTPPELEPALYVFSETLKLRVGEESKQTAGREVVLEYQDQLARGPNRLDMRALQDAASGDPHRYGMLLADGILADEGLEALARNALNIRPNIAQRRAALNFLLDVDDAFRGLYWEYLLLPGPQGELRPPAALASVTFTRYAPGLTDRDPVPARPLRVLIAAVDQAVLDKLRDFATPSFPPLYPLDAALPMLRSVLEPLGGDAHVVVDVVDNLTPKVLAERLRGGYHVIHLLTHVVAYETGSRLVLDDGDGAPQLVNADDFSWEEAAETLRLVTIAGAPTREQNGSPAQVVQRLLERGVSACLAFQEPLTDGERQQFYAEFYRELLRDGDGAAAVSAGRRALYSRNPTGWAWGGPALFTRGFRGHLFDLEVEPLEVDVASPPAAQVAFEEVSHASVVPAGFMPEARVVLTNGGATDWPVASELRIRATDVASGTVYVNNWVVSLAQKGRESPLRPGQSLQTNESFNVSAGQVATVTLRWDAELTANGLVSSAAGPTTTIEYVEPYQLTITGVTLPATAAPGEAIAAALQLAHAGGFTTWRQRDELAATATWQTADGTPLAPPLETSKIINEDAAVEEPRFPLRGLTAPAEAGDYLLAVTLVHRGQFGQTRAAYTTTTPLPVRAPERHDFTVERVDLPASLRPGADATPTFQLRNSGNVAWTPGDVIRVAPADGNEVDITLELGVPPGVTLPLSHPDLRLTVPEEQPAGPLTLTWQLSNASWGASTAATHTFSVAERLPDIAGTLVVDFQLPPAGAWTQRRLRTPVSVTNAGARSWADGAAQLYFRQIRADETLADEKTRPLSALAPGATTTIQFQVDLADPGEQADPDIMLAWQLLHRNGGAPALLDEHTAQPLLVVTPEKLTLPRLLDAHAFLDDLPATLQARRLTALGRRLADDALTAEMRRDYAAEQLLPALLDKSGVVRAAALAALFDLRAHADSLDDLLTAALDAAGDSAGFKQTLRAAAPAVAAWIDPLLPAAFFAAHEERPVTQIQLPAVLQAPPADHTLSVELLASEVRAVYGDIEGRSPLDAAKLDALEGAREGSPETYGRLLFEIVFSADQLPAGEYRATRDVYAFARTTAANRLRVELRTADSLGAIFWEYLRDGGAALPMATFEGAPFYRRFGSNPVAPVDAAPLRVLFAISNPRTLGAANARGAIAGLAALNVAQERAIIEKDVGPLQAQGLLQYALLDGGEGPVTLAALRARITEFDPHVVHIIAHGITHERYGALLVLQNDSGDHAFVQPDSFDAPLLTRDPLRLIVLAACQSARPGAALQGMGRQLIKNGVAAVIAMQDNVKVKTAQLFNQRFYGDLLRTGQVDMALAATRYDLYHAGPQSWEWGIPVLFLGSGRTDLFNTDSEKAAQLDRPALQELDLQGYEQLPGGDPTLEMAQRALEERVREVAQGNDALLAAVRGALGQAPPVAGGDAPLAKPQPRGLLDKLETPLALTWEGLRRFVLEDPKGSGLRLPDAVFKQVVAALNTGKHLLLTGPPGTGKTSLAHDVCLYAESLEHARGAALTTATADWTTFDTIGGYVPTQQQTLQFRPGTFLEAVSQGEWLVIDEMNRAEIDKAFGELFTVLSGQRVDLPYRVGETQVRIFPPAKGDEWQGKAQRAYDYVVHPNWRIIGTMNVYDKSYLYKMSFAFMRRFAFVDVDLPQRAIFQGLLDGWLQEAAIAPPAAADNTAIAGWSAFNRALSKLINPQDNDLMSRRALGPAIFKDILAYVGQRFSAEAGNHAHLLAFLGEAFQLYAAPQLDGLDREGIGRVYRFVMALFADLDDGGDLVEGNPLRVLLTRIEMLYPHLQPDDWESFRAAEGGAGGGSGIVEEG